MNPIATAAASLISAADRFSQASAKLANPAESGDAGAVVDQISAKTQFEASAKVMKVGEEMFKDTLDILV